MSYSSKEQAAKQIPCGNDTQKGKRKAPDGRGFVCFLILFKS